MKMPARSLLAAALLTAWPADAAEISTHVLDLASGVGGQGVPVVLSRRGPDGAWQEMARGTTDPAGRIRSFGPSESFGPAIYRLSFDMAAYPTPTTPRFFPEINLVFRVSDASAHYHVPVVVSPYGYSTYRGN